MILLYRMLKRCISFLFVCFLACLPLSAGCAAGEAGIPAGAGQTNMLTWDDSAARDLLEQLDRQLIDMETFLKSFRDLDVVSSTLFGENSFGMRVGYFVSSDDGAAFFPVFTSPERAKAYFDQGKRQGYLLIVDSFMGSLESTKMLNEILRENTLFSIELGIIIDPDDYAVTIDVSMLDQVIEMLQ